MPLGNPEQHLPHRPMPEKEHAELIARTLLRDYGIEVKVLATEGDPTVHFHIDIPTHRILEVPVVVPEGRVQIELQPNHLKYLSDAQEASEQDLAA